MINRRKRMPPDHSQRRLPLKRKKPNSARLCKRPKLLCVLKLLLWAILSTPTSQSATVRFVLPPPNEFNSPSPRGTATQQDNNAIIETFCPQQYGSLEKRTDILPHHEVLFRLGAV